MAEIPAHYHQLPRITGTDTIYPVGLPLWDAAGKRIVVGDGVTPGGIPQAKQGDETTYNRKLVAANTAAVNRDWVIATATCHVELPPASSILQCIRISAVGYPVQVTDEGTIIYDLIAGTTIECVCPANDSWIVVEANLIPDLDNYLQKVALTFNNDVNSPVTFKTVTYAEYTEALRMNNVVQGAIYYVTDTKQVILNGVSYGADVVVLVTSFPTTGAEGKLYWNTTTGEIKCYVAGTGWVSSNKPATTTINSTSSDYYVPTAKAVYDFVDTKIAEKLTPLDNLLIQFKNTNFEALAGYFYICTTDDLVCDLPLGTEGDLIRFMAKGCTNIHIRPGAGTVLDDEDGEGVLLDIENATVTLYRAADGWSVIEY